MVTKINNEQNIFNDQINTAEVLYEKLNDAMTPGYKTEFDPNEAETVGAFVEDALSENDAIESNADLLLVNSIVLEEKEG